VGDWSAWRSALAALFALSFDSAALEAYRRHTGRQLPPKAPAREAWLVCGRRSGKPRTAALIGVYLATFKSYREILAPGERAVVMLLATDRDQARGSSATSRRW
jgi:hypothetical protein